MLSYIVSFTNECYGAIILVFLLSHFNLKFYLKNSLPSVNSKSRAWKANDQTTELDFGEPLDEPIQWSTKQPSKPTVFIPRTRTGLRRTSLARRRHRPPPPPNTLLTPQHRRLASGDADELPRRFKVPSLASVISFLNFNKLLHRARPSPSFLPRLRRRSRRIRPHVPPPH